MKFLFSYAGIYGIHERSMEMIGTWLGGLGGGEGLAPSWLVRLKADRVDQRERTGRYRGFSEKLLRVLMYFQRPRRCADRAVGKLAEPAGFCELDRRDHVKATLRIWNESLIWRYLRSSTCNVVYRTAVDWCPLS